MCIVVRLKTADYDQVHVHVLVGSTQTYARFPEKLMLFFYTDKNTPIPILISGANTNMASKVPMAFTPLSPRVNI